MASKIIGVRWIDINSLEELQQWCDDHGFTVSEGIRYIVERYLDNEYSTED